MTVMAYRILTATYSDRIETLLFDSEARSLSIMSSLTVGHHPSWITPHPENPAIWFTALEQEDGRAVVIEYDKEGKGNIVGEIPSEGAEPCTLVVYKGDLLIGNVSPLSFRLPTRYLPALLFIRRRVRYGPTLCVVRKWKRCRVSADFFCSLCCVVYDEAHADRFWTRRESTVFVSPSPSVSTSDP